MRRFSAQVRVWIVLVASGLAGCGLEPPQRWGLTADAGATAQPGEHPQAPGAITRGQGSPGCLPILGGELVINELLPRPAGVDIDGDGESNQRDEAIELRLSSVGPRHLQGVALWVAGQQRGQLTDPSCHPPGALLVLVSSTTGPLALPQGSAQVRLSGPLALRDDGAVVALIGRGGGVLDQLAYPAAPAARSLVRTPEGSRWAPLEAHPDTPAGSGHSLGMCSDGAAPDRCWAAPTAPAG